MKISTLDPTKYKRLFTFGCSFTNYIWPTWADIVGQDFEFYENWGRTGAGNHFIFNSVMECDARHNFTHGDLILIMWSNPEREDRYINQDWLCASIQDKEKVYGKKWVQKFGLDIRGYLIRDLAYIKATQEFLNSKSVDWANFSMYSICSLDISNILKDGYTYAEHLDLFVKRYVALDRSLCDGNPIREPYAKDIDVLNLYRSTYSNISYSMLDVIRNGHAFREGLANFGDLHCTPIEHLHYLNSIYPDNTLSEKSKIFAEHWEKVVQKITKKDVLPETFIKSKVIRF